MDSILVENSLNFFVEEAVRKNQLPAVSIAIWSDNRLTAAAAGLLNLNTGVVASTDSIFQIGSITKVMTTCLVMQLVDEGRVDLDTPVQTLSSRFYGF